jgi:hypothetical protein
MAFVLENGRIGQIEHASQRVADAIRDAHVVCGAVPKGDDVLLQDNGLYLY